MKGKVEIKMWADMSADEKKDAWKTMEEQVMNPRWCTTEIPLYKCSMPCGEPVICFEDDVETMLVPTGMYPRGATYAITVRGDSMIGAGIQSGDVLIVRNDVPAEDGDIVVALVDSCNTVKTFFCDKEGNKWLLPLNSEYNPILLRRDYPIELRGCVMHMVRKVSSVSYRECEKILSAACVGDDESGKEVREFVISAVDRRIKNVINVMKAEGAFKYLYDYTWVMLVMNDTRGLPDFDSPQSFLRFLNDLGLEGLPEVTSVKKMNNKVSGLFPNWVFTDKDKTEANRCINVAKRFLSLYRSYQGDDWIG